MSDDTPNVDGPLPTFDVPPGVTLEGWTLAVTGAVESTLRPGREDLLAMESRTVTEDFECLEGWTVEGLTWRGVPVARVLDRAGPTASATHGLVRAADGEYACGFDLDRLRGALLAVELDGEPLALEHGGPARLVPTDADSDCWESVKWTAEIELREGRPTEADTAERIARSRPE